MAIDGVLVYDAPCVVAEKGPRWPNAVRG